MTAWIEPDLRLVRAGNRSPMTHTGTNTWMLGRGTVVVIDPGPGERSHLAAILEALEPGERVGHILVTHAHADHSALARPLAAATGAPVLGFGPATAGRSTVMEGLAGLGGGEGLDAAFLPDETLSDGDRIVTADGTISVLWTPGHFAGHLSFLWRDAIFTGDLVMGWASTMISPPDGDLAAFRRSVGRLGAMGARVFYPGHGEAVGDPAGRSAWLLAHRDRREREILDALSGGAASAGELVAHLYADTPPALHPAAARNVLAHLIDLWQRGAVEALSEPAPGTRFRLVPG